jgi:hypothetical protein
LLVGVVLTLLSAGAALAASPVIDSFYTNTTAIKPGYTVTLTWKTTNAVKVQLLGIEKEVEAFDLPLSGEQEVWPETSTSYILVATGDDGTVTAKSLSVNVGTTGTVKVDYFKVSPQSVQPKQTVSLSWKVTNGISTRILGITPNQEKNLECVRPIEGSLEAWPETTTIYLVEATGVNKEIASMAVAANVKELAPVTVKILSFTASSTTISKGEMIQLSWTTENAVKCTIKTSEGAELPNRPVNGKIAVTPNKSRTYTLYAYDAVGNKVEASVAIVVK